MSNTPKKKLYLVPHTHWDREWYFTKETGDVLLNHMLNDVFNFGEKAYIMLDGQTSLLDDYIKWNPERKEVLQKLMKSQKVSAGPFYSQPDVFNSQAETTIRNIEVSQKFSKDMGVDQLKTAYFPDTFGFNQNLPQIFRMKNLENFIFWRGASKEQVEQSYYFNWKGIDGSEVKAYNFVRGYYSLGMYYPYNGVKSGPKYDINLLTEKIDKRADDVVIDSDVLILPLGGDQAPYMHETPDLIAKVNTQSKYDIQLLSNFDKFFEEAKKPTVTFDGDLKNPYAGKIHRTISSSRYDIKKSFRDAEDNLYYLLEPLEVFYSKVDKDYHFENFKTENIVKPLLIAQTHDSLGGCNTDATNDKAMSRISRADDHTISQVDLLIKKIIQDREIANESLVVFNPAPFERNIFERKIVYSDEFDEINISNDDVSIQTLNARNISLNKEKKINELDVVIYKKNLKAVDVDVTDIAQAMKDNQNDIAESKTNNINITGSKIEFNTIKDKFSLSFRALEDCGDSYDFSPGKTLDIKQTHKLVKTIAMSDNVFYHQMSSTLKIGNEVTPITWNVFEENGKLNVDFELTNAFRSTRVSLIVENVSNNVVKKSQHLAISDFFNEPENKDWKNTLNEYPAPVDHNDGLIQVDDLNIFTKGNNEFYKTDSHVEIVLYRSYDLVTKANGAWRPSTSGLSFEWDSRGSKHIGEKLRFEFGFSNEDPVKGLNVWKFKPYSYKFQQRNFIANKMSKFVVNEILNRNDATLDIKISDNVFVSSMRKIGNDLHLRLANMNDESLTAKITLNNKVDEISFKKYEIKEIIKKGAFNGK